MRTHKVTIYKTVDGQFSWRRKAGNGRIIAIAGEAYRNREDARRNAIHTNATPFKLYDSWENLPESSPGYEEVDNNRYVRLGEEES